ncbi:DNA polymerase III subunit alpha [bacterium BMS3Bbin03]|nr:DNA polymerase III subunit alpha [bacterium BMS3Bbin03]
MSPFIHLHNHTHYSLLDGACRIEDMVQLAVQYKMPALAITDHGNMFGVIEFYKKAKAAGIKPVIGVEAYIAPESRFNKTSQKGRENAYHIVLLAKNRDGYRNLLKLVSAGFLEGFYYKPRIDKELLMQHHEGLIALTACLHGEVPHKMIKQGMDAARESALEYKKIFGEDFYLEIQNHAIEAEADVRHGMLELSRELGIPLVATNDIHYLKREHADAHDILLCLQTGKDYDDPTRLRYNTKELYFKSPEEMETLFKDYPGAIKNTFEIAEKCDLKIPFGTLHLPGYEIPPDEEVKTLDDYLEKLAWEGLQKRYSEITPEIKQRFDHEISVIKQMGFSGYFLIVCDFISYARSKGIPVGPGRGSAAGSLVSYAVGITNINPLRYNLIFERFLNPERVTMPDIDIDFCYERREEVIDYVRQKYGEKNVTQIITFGTMAARAVIRDVGRVLKMRYSDVDKIAKMIPPNTKLKEAIKEVPELKEIVKNSEDEIYKKLFEYALVLEGLSRHASTHAAGVVIAPEELTNFLPLYKSKEGDVTTQYDMKWIEEIGLLKMDFLGLRTLTVIDKTIKLLQKRNVTVDLEHIPLDDPKTYELFSEGETVGVFQFESSGMREYLRKLKPNRIEDLIAMNALYRPGPMKNIDNFIDCKQGVKEIDYIHPLLEQVLSETYGVIVYQEQVMQIASRIAKFTLGGADVLRWAMGKKKTKLMKEQRAKFITGAGENGIPNKKAQEIFDLMDSFAKYGFNKSHAAGYSVVAYQTAYLKAHFPAEFMAASLSSEMGNASRVMILMDECKRMGINVLPPDVNESFANFNVVGGNIRFGLGAIKNVGHGAIRSIIKSRQKYGKFKTLFDFVQHLDLRLVNKKVLESLIQAGALDSIQGHRARLFAAVEVAINYAQSIQNEHSLGQTSIFDLGNSDTQGSGRYPDLPEAERWDKKKELALEKELLGFYLSGHPLSRYKEDIQTFSTIPLSHLTSLNHGTAVRVGGIVTQVRTHLDRKQNTMAFVTIEDFTAHSDVVVFSDTYEKHRSLLQPDSMVLLSGQVSKQDESSAKIICSDLIPLSHVREKYAKTVCMNLQIDTLKDENLSDLLKLLQARQGKCAVLLHIINGNKREYLIRSNSLLVPHSEEFLDLVRKILGQENVWLEG